MRMDELNLTSVLRTLLARGQALQGGLCAWGGLGTARLQKLVRAELAFLDRLASVPLTDAASWHALRSSNLDHLEAVFRILQHPLIDGVSAVMQNLAVAGPGNSVMAGVLAPASKGNAHVDVACMFDGKPVWLIVLSRNPRYVHWLDEGKHVKGLRSRLLLLLEAASVDAVKQPKSLVLCFSGEVAEDVDRGLRDEFHAIHMQSLIDGQPSTRLGDELFTLRQECKFSDVDGWEWLDFEVKKCTFCRKHAWETYEVASAWLKQVQRVEGPAELLKEVNHGKELVGRKIGNIGELGIDVFTPSSEFQAACGQESRIIRSVQSSSYQALGQPSSARDAQRLVNLDTTAMVALVSEVSNGGASFLIALPPEDLESRFPSMHAFIREQALSERDQPLVPEIEDAIACRQPIVSQYVHEEFLSIVSQVGGPKENDRARKLLQSLRVVPNTPSNRVMSLPTSGRIKNRHKIVFGTGDFYNAPTLTANMGFVRAAKGKGMPIAILEHRPRALTGD